MQLRIKHNNKNLIQKLPESKEALALVVLAQSGSGMKSVRDLLFNCR